ncbi:hypothetical protein H257_13418 [Aphanomyces astaci]|uniref:Uncharacterized protein n=1 Tax=Aphanomyces astaci TaxID=112090 RepID=W4FUU9_APHAT|nr:hypothetical protein H257_13418 [Aphanomyces astaci]ETV71280.1 hypothetical protein H257_13418 [Aphanomyces astaci]|eukprot:XP_009839220.1 hypothetical protein H257_13418 [Aphanomyces astaci]
MDFCRRKNIAYSTWQDWQARRDKNLASRRHSRNATLGGQGLQELIPFNDELLVYMRDRRGSGRYVRLLVFQEELVAYKLFRTLLLRFFYRHRFFNRVPCKGKDKYAQYDKSQILNVDETAIFYDLPPGKTLAEIGMDARCLTEQSTLTD